MRFLGNMLGILVALVASIVIGAIAASLSGALFIYLFPGDTLMLSLSMLMTFFIVAAKIAEACFYILLLSNPPKG